MTYRIQLTVYIPLPNPLLLNAVFAAIEPEVRALPEVSKRSTASVSIDGTRLVLHLEATDFSAMRAAMNSFLRWIAAITDAVSAVESIERRTESAGKSTREASASST
ncbi:hypothetical protein DRN94_001485 [archaeon]|nr:hypothetical protein [archaeon]